MTLYAGTILLTELMMLAMIIHVMNYSGFTKVEKTWYIATFGAIMVCALAEFTAKHFDARGSGFVLPLTVITVIQFSLAPLLPVFFAGALGMRKVAKTVGAFFSINVIVEAIAAPLKLIFYFDENGKYWYARFYFLYEAFYIVSMIFLIIALFIVSKRFRRRDVLTIVMVLVILGAANLPVILYKVYTGYIGIALCSCLCYIYYSDLIQEDIQAELVAQ